MRNTALTRLLDGPIPMDWAFPLSEYQARLEAVREAMAAERLDVLLLHSVVDLCYLTGYDTVWPGEYMCLVVPATGDPFFHLGDFAVSNAILNGPIRQFHTLRWTEFQEDPAFATRQLAETLGEHGFAEKRIGVQKGRIEIGEAVGHRVSECIVVTEDGCEVLTDLSRELVVKSNGPVATSEADSDKTHHSRGGR
jgi:Xaa-Pro aminopeptidase